MHLRHRVVPAAQHRRGAGPHRHGLLTTVAYQIGDAARRVRAGRLHRGAGALVQWLRDNLGSSSTAAEIDDLAASVSDNGGCYLVPASPACSRRTGGQTPAA